MAHPGTRLDWKMRKMVSLCMNKTKDCYHPLHLLGLKLELRNMGKQLLETFSKGNWVKKPIKHYLVVFE